MVFCVLLILLHVILQHIPSLCPALSNTPSWCGALQRTIHTVNPYTQANQDSKLTQANTAFHMF